jgi:hypothetical protein
MPMVEVKIRVHSHELAAHRFVARILQVPVAQIFRTGGLSYSSYVVASFDEGQVPPEHLEELRRVRGGFGPLWPAAQALAEVYDLDAE